MVEQASQYTVAIRIAGVARRVKVGFLPAVVATFMKSQLKLARMVFRIKEKQELTVEDRVTHAKHAKMAYKIKEKMELTAEDRVIHAKPAMMAFKTKEKMELTAEDHVMRVKILLKEPVKTSMYSAKWNQPSF